RRGQVGCALPVRSRLARCCPAPAHGAVHHRGDGMTTKTKDLTEELKGVLAEARKITDAAEAAGGELSADDQAQIKSYFERATELKGRIEQARETDQMTAALAELEGVDYEPARAKQAPTQGHRRENETLGE